MSTPETPQRPARRQRRLHRRALKNLRTALGEAGDQLTPDWVLRDRDLKTLQAPMKADPTWGALMEQLREAHGEAPTAKVPGGRPGKVTVPAHPWPALVPIVLWLVFTTSFGVLWYRAVTNSAYWLFIVAAAVGALVSAAFLRLAIDRRVLRRGIVRRARRRGVQEPPPDQPAK